MVVSHLVRCTYMALGKTGRGVGVGDKWIKPGDGNWEIDHRMHLYNQLTRAWGRTSDHSCDVVS